MPRIVLTMHRYKISRLGEQHIVKANELHILLRTSVMFIEVRFDPVTNCYSHRTVFL